jgi:hypothetical protein
VKKVEEKTKNLDENQKIIIKQVAKAIIKAPV